MSEWAKVITHPLGLAGFSLFVLLIFLTRRQALLQPVWLRVSFIVMAFIALLGGLLLAYLNTASLPTAEKTSAQQKPLPVPKAQTEASQQNASSESQVNQKTAGSGSPAVANTGGDVTITVTNP